jgi:phage terminase large subunit-like protein
VTVEAPKRDAATLSRAEWLAHFAPSELHALLDDLTEGEAEALMHEWAFWRRPAQTEPSGPWTFWFVRAGRGFGKTRLGAEATRERVNTGKAARIALIAPTAADVRDVMVEGPSGVLATAPGHERPEYEPSKRRLTWPNGAVGTTYSADEPERLRGPEHDWAWCDEPGSWRFGKAAFDNLSLGLRSGRAPAALLTGTPKPVAWLREVDERPETVNTRGSTYDNLANLPEAFIADVLNRYEGTRLGRQELHAEWLDDVEGALWHAELLDSVRVNGWVPTLGESRIVIGVDPPGETAECGIITVAGPRRPSATAHVYVLHDDSLAGPPEKWGEQVVMAYRRAELLGLPVLVKVEANQGGDMVRAVIHAVDPNVTVQKVHASVSKAKRAEPVSVLYVRGRAHHVGFLAVLESQMVTWVPGDASPDRMDALVHAIADLLPPITIAPSSVTSVADRTVVMR